MIGNDPVRFGGGAAENGAFMATAPTGLPYPTIPKNEGASGGPGLFLPPGPRPATGFAWPLSRSPEVLCTKQALSRGSPCQEIAGIAGFSSWRWPTPTLRTPSFGYR